MKIALASGHHNSSGGNAYEAETTGLLTPLIAAACRALGMEVRVVQPGDGKGSIGGDVSAVGATVTAWARAGWAADVFLETHTQGVANPDVRGVFVIHPDAQGDVDADARDGLGPEIARGVAAATGMPVFGDGVMSERETAVGRSGFRLGVFAATVALKATATRLLVEYGSHTHAGERRMHRDPAWLKATAEATARAIARWGGLKMAEADPTPQPQAEPLRLTPNGPVIVGGFRAYFEANGGLLALGFPLTDERPERCEDGATRTVQWFERARLEYHPDAPEGWRVVPSRLGALEYARRTAATA